jgi:hypothetical protein
MSLADRLAYLAETKELIREAINGRGGTLTEAEAFRAYAAAVAGLPAGGGGGRSGGLRDAAEVVLREERKLDHFGLRDAAEISFKPAPPPQRWHHFGLREAADVSFLEVVTCIADEVVALRNMRDSERVSLFAGETAALSDAAEAVVLDE